MEYFISNHGPLRALNRLHMNYLVTQNTHTHTHTRTHTHKKKSYINEDQDRTKVDKNTNNRLHMQTPTILGWIMRMRIW